jgi:hypothetical protein
VSAWFISERLVFNRHKGGKWLADILDDVSASSYRRMKKIALETPVVALTWSFQVVRRASVPLRRMSAMFSPSSVDAERADDVESIPPTYDSPTIIPSTEYYDSKVQSHVTQ